MGHELAGVDKPTRGLLVYGSFRIGGTSSCDSVAGPRRRWAIDKGDPAIGSSYGVNSVPE